MLTYLGRHRLKNPFPASGNALFLGGSHHLAEMWTIIPITGHVFCNSGALTLLSRIASIAKNEIFCHFCRNFLKLDLSIERCTFSYVIVLISLYWTLFLTFFRLKVFYYVEYKLGKIAYLDALFCH